MDPLAAVRRLRAARAALERCGDPDARAFGEGLAEYEEVAAKDVGLEECVGLARLPGQVGWWALEAIARRNAALCALAAQHFAEKRPAQAAFEIHRLSTNYASGCWRFDKSREEMPDGYAGTVREHLWRAFKADPDMPIAKRTLQRILSANRRSKAA